MHFIEEREREVKDANTNCKLGYAHGLLREGFLQDCVDVGIVCKGSVFFFFFFFFCLEMPRKCKSVVTELRKLMFFVSDTIEIIMILLIIIL